MSKLLRKSTMSVALFAGLLAVGTAYGQANDRGDTGGSAGVTPVETVNAGALADSFQYDEIIVGYREVNGRAADMREVYADLDRVAAATGVTLSLERTLATGGQLVRLGRSLDDNALIGLMNALASNKNVAYVEPNQIMSAFLTPNDSSYSQMWHYFEATGGANLPTAWDTATGTGVVVAVLDTGIANHTDLNANVVAGYDFVSSATNARDGNGRDSNPADQGDWVTAGQCYSGSPASNSSWHGTHVAGTIAAVTNNAAGIAGVAFNAKVQPVRVLAACGGTLADIADAIVWSSGGTVSGIPANPTPAKVINMSLGGSSATCPSTYQTAINTAVSRGTTVVVAAGNSNVNASGATPANCTGVINVAATNRSGGKAYYSNFGTNVDVAAPGGDVRSAATNGVLSTLNAGTTTPGAQSYAWYQGTSMATPHVAGLAALILSRSATQTPAQVETLIKNNARAFPATCSGCGTGIINAAATVAAVGGGGGGGGGGTSFFENTTDVQIRDLMTVESAINVTGRTGNAPSNLQAGVTIYHTYRGDLQIDLVAPNGTSFRLKNISSSDSADNVIATYTVNASAVVANGTWRLRVRDAYSGDTGYIDRWSLQF